jgi:hypothetical protein
VLIESSLSRGHPLGPEWSELLRVGGVKHSECSSSSLISYVGLDPTRALFFADAHSVPVVVTILSGMSRDNLFVAVLVGASLLSMMLLGVALLLRW